jgi:2-polyprenyl-3-methyl-5-hydroxy-6-metoxy-1,4-benzoquinol methylase
MTPARHFMPCDLSCLRAPPCRRPYRVVACVECGCVYADTAGTRADYERYYAHFSHYQDPAVATGGGEQPFDRQRLAETAAWLAAQVAPGARILDVGAGNGGLLHALRELGFTRLAGMDPAPACVERMRSRGFEAYQGWLGDAAPASVGYDLIVLSHVLEHLLEPRAALSALQGWLAAHGKVYVETPDAARYADFPSVPFYYFDSEHINHFDVASLSNLAAVSGFRTEAAGQKTLALMAAQGYPAAYALLTPVGAPMAIQPNGATSAAVCAYVAQSAQTAQLPEKLALALAAGRPIALWGAGSQAQRLLQDAAFEGAHLVAVVDADRNKQGRMFAGCIIAEPAIGLADLPANTLLVIAAALVAEQIVVAYRGLGLSYDYLIN